MTITISISNRIDRFWRKLQFCQEINLRTVNDCCLSVIESVIHQKLVTECTYNTMTANGTVVGGLSTSEEMCNAFITYYPEIDLDGCASEYPRSELQRKFGIESLLE